MGTLKEKEVFLTKLKGDRVILTARTHSEWYDLIVSACELGILRRVNRAKMQTDTREYKINYPITLNDLSNEGFVGTVNNHFIGECIVFRLCYDAMGDGDCI